MGGLGACGIDVARDRLSHGLQKRIHLRLPPFQPKYPEYTPGPIDLVKAQRSDLAAAHSVNGEKHQDCTIADVPLANRLRHAPEFAVRPTTPALTAVTPVHTGAVPGWRRRPADRTPRHSPYIARTRGVRPRCPRSIHETNAQRPPSQSTRQHQLAQVHRTVDRCARTIAGSREFSIAIERRLTS